MGINQFFNQTITIQNRTGKDLHAQSSWSAAVEARVRFEKTRKTIATSNREREPIDAVVFAQPGTNVEVGDLITYMASDYKVMTKDDMVDGKGTLHHIELKVQTWHKK